MSQLWSGHLNSYRSFHPLMGSNCNEIILISTLKVGKK